MTAPHVLPAFIPDELCTTHGIETDRELNPDAPDECVDALHADLHDDGVSAPGLEPGQLDALKQVVADARDGGVDLKVVVIDDNPWMDTALRDVATEVGIVAPDSTVLVLSPSFAGTYSTTYDRVTLEAGEDVAKAVHGDPAQATQAFVDELHAPQFPWTGLTIALVILVAVAVAATRFLQVRARRSAPAS
ncbi:Rv1476 family membrane protein [Mycolicibacterium thermoresistibile]